MQIAKPTTEPPKSTVLNPDRQRRYVDEGPSSDDEDQKKSDKMLKVAKDDE